MFQNSSVKGIINKERKNENHLHVGPRASTDKMSRTMDSND